jgi:hypothetical protein
MNRLDEEAACQMLDVPDGTMPAVKHHLEAASTRGSNSRITEIGSLDHEGWRRRSVNSPAD